jgi:septum formation protein
MKKLILASQSPRRQQLLSWAEIPFDVRVSDADESFPAHMSVQEVPVFIARNKADAVAGQVGDAHWILAADTIVVLDSLVIGKPVDEADAIRILQLLSGKTHRVITGVVCKKGSAYHQFTDITEVQFHPITLEQIRHYVHTYKPYDKAGAYAIQEWMGVVGIHSIRGDFYNVMGLPISRVAQWWSALPAV